MSLAQLALDKNSTQLLVVDIQERLFSVFKKDVQDEIERNVKILLAAAKHLELPVVATEQYPKGLGSTVPAIAGDMGETPRIEKMAFSCMGEPQARDAITANTNDSTVVVTGIETHVCVFQTALDLLDAGYAVHVPQDAVGSRTKDNWRRGLDLLDKAGAVVTSTETVLFQLLKVAGTPEFKALAPLVR